MCFTPIVLTPFSQIDTAALSRVVDGKEVKGKEANSNSKNIQKAGSAYGAACFFFPFSEWRTKKSPNALWARPGRKKCGAFKAPHGLFYSALPWPFFCRLRRRASMRMNSFTSSMSSAERASLASA